MSHFTVMVVTTKEQSIKKVLAPFNENLSVPHTISKEEQIMVNREGVSKYEKTTYAEYLENPKEYLKNCTEGHRDYITQKFPLKLKWTDEEHLTDSQEWVNSEDIN